MSNDRGPRFRSASLALGGLALVVGLATGCSASEPDDTAAPPPAATTTGTATPSPTASPTPATPVTTAGSDPTAASGGSGGSVPLCGTPDLTAEVAPQPGGGAAGSVTYDLALVNGGTATCRMEGWPGVSFVAGGDGQQVGAAADRVDPDQLQTVTLIPGARALSTVRVADAGAYGDDCDVTQARGLRVYPPDNQRSLFAALPTQACASDSAHLLQVAPVHPVS